MDEYAEYIEIQDLSGKKLDTTKALHHGDKFAVKLNLTQGYHLGTLNITGASLTNEVTTDGLPIYEIIADNKTADDKYIVFNFEQQINTYTVHFLDETGAELPDYETQQVQYDKYATVAEPTKQPTQSEQYRFVGWLLVDAQNQPILDENNTKQYINFSEDSIKADTYVQAEFEASAREYTLNISANDNTNVKVVRDNGEIMDGGTICYGDELTISYNLSDGHHLSEFSLNGQPVSNEHTFNVTGDVNISFAEAINHYTIVFHSEKQEDGGETELSRVTVKYNEKATYDKEQPTKQQDNTFTYEFACWATADGQDATNQLKNVNLGDDGTTLNVYAKFNATYIEYKLTIPDNVTVTYVSGTSTQYDSNKTLATGNTVHYGDTIQVSYTENEGYHKDSLTVTGANLVEGNYVVTGNVEIAYEQAVNTYKMGTIPAGVTVSRKNGDQVHESDDITHFEVLTVSYTLSEGHHRTEFTVAGKPVEEGKTSTTVTVSGQFNITFKEEINTYTIVFHSEKQEDGGETELSRVTVKYNEKATYDKEQPTKQQDETFTYKFANWTLENGDDATTRLNNVKEGAHLSVLDVYAKFDATYIEYAVTFPDHVTVTYVSGTSTQYNEHNYIKTGNTVHYGDLKSCALPLKNLINASVAEWQTHGT